MKIKTRRRMRAVFKSLAASALGTILLLPMLTFASYAAQSTTYTYSADKRGWLVRTQDAYLPDRTITDLRLSKPEDIFIDDNNMLYIADTGNKRIVIYNIDNGQVESEIKNDVLKTPRGIYVTANGDIYVADSSAQSVFRFNSKGELNKTFSRPESPAFGETEFKPYRVAVDLRGNLYIIGEGVYNGIIQLSVEGEFLGYFASNKTTRSITEILQDIFFTDAQKAGLLDRVPTTFSNVYTDYKGVVYSASMGAGDEGTGVKKHNMAGKNMFSEIFSFDSIADLTVDKNGIIYAVDITGYTMIYTPDGSFVFLFGAEKTEEDIAGMYSTLMSVAVSPSGHLWMLDNEKAFLQSYTPTEYTLSIYKALKLFDEGYYEKAGDQWNDVLHYNQMSVLAHNGLGKSLLYRQEYEDASMHFELAGNRKYFSQSYWETRNQWLLNNLYWIIIIIVFIIICSSIIKLVDRKRVIKNFIKKGMGRITGLPWLKNFFFVFRVTRHPLDSYYYLKRKQGGSIVSAAVCFAMFFFAFMYNQVGKAFILQYTQIEDMDMGVVVGGFFAVFALFISCNYLVTSIKDGEGSLAQIFQVVSYGMVPAAFTLILYTVITYVITFNEIFLLDFLMAIGFIWSGVLIYLGLQEVHNYNVRNNVVSLIITAIFIVIIIIILFNLTILGEQFGQFIEAITRELISNVQNTY